MLEPGAVSAFVAARNAPSSAFLARPCRMASFVFGRVAAFCIWGGVVDEAGACGCEGTGCGLERLAEVDGAGNGFSSPVGEGAAETCIGGEGTACRLFTTVFTPAMVAASAAAVRRSGSLLTNPFKVRIPLFD